MKPPSSSIWLVTLLAVLAAGLLIALSQLSAHLAMTPAALTDSAPEPRQAERSSQTLPANGEGLPSAPKAKELPEQPTLGDPSAPVVIVEFAEFYCPYCAKFTWETFPQIERDYIRTGLVRYEFRNLVIHGAPALLAASAGECVHAQGRFWPFLDRIFEAVFPGRSLYQHQQLGVEDLEELAAQVGLDKEAFSSCLEDFNEQYGYCMSAYNRCTDGQGDEETCQREFTDCMTLNAVFREIMSDRDSIGALIEGLPSEERAQAKRIGTPTFFINGHILIGAQPYTAFRRMIDRELEREGVR
jgi:protein-disulfide isomerase